MRKYIHISLIIFALALPCFGQFTEIWTNGDLFATEQMASQCYSASVERCQAVGVTPDSPSWWDYIVGKNHAKLVSVKANIEACFSNYVYSIDYSEHPERWDGPIDYVQTSLLPYSYKAKTYTDKATLLSGLGLQTNFFEDTGYFKLQYASTSNGWHDAKKVLGNLLWTREKVDWHPNVWTNQYSSSTVLYRLLPTEFEFTIGLGAVVILGDIHLLGITPTYNYEGSNYGATSIFWPVALYSSNARGSWTTYSYASSWATSWSNACTGVENSFIYTSTNWPTNGPSATQCGMYWQYVMNPYMVKARPKTVVGGVQDGYVTNIIVSITGTNYLAETNSYESFVTTNAIPATNFAWGSIIHYETNVEESINYDVETNGWAEAYSNVVQKLTNTVPVTNRVYYIVGYSPSIVSMGTAFVGHLSTNHVDWTTYSNTYSAATNIVTTNYLVQVDDIPILTNVNPVTVYATNVWDWYEYFDTTNIQSIYTNYDGYYTNLESYFTSTNYTRETNDMVQGRFAAGKSEISGVPYIGNLYSLLPNDANTEIYGMRPLCTNLEAVVSFLYYFGIPTNFPPLIHDGMELEPWHGYNSEPPINIDKYTISSVYDSNDLLNFVDSYFNLSIYPEWVYFNDSVTNKTSSIIFGKTIAAYASAGATWGYWDRFTTAFSGTAPTNNQVTLEGWEIMEEFSLLDWTATTNGFKYK